MTKQDLMELCVVDTHTANLWSFTTKEKAEADVSSAKANAAEHFQFWESLDSRSRNPQDKAIADSYRNSDYKVMTFGDFLKLERKKMLDKPLEEITADHFEEMFNVLPPIAHTKRKGVEMFCSMEFFTGSYTSQYAHDHNTGEFYTKLVDYNDQSTWIYEILYPNH